jgi:hypothetical protein
VLLFALDQNFPSPIVNVLTDYQVDTELVSLGSIDGRLGELETGRFSSPSTITSASRLDLAEGLWLRRWPIATSFVW